LSIYNGSWSDVLVLVRLEHYYFDVIPTPLSEDLYLYEILSRASMDESQPPVPRASGNRKMIGSFSFVHRLKNRIGI
jgi:hypothetical protein